MPASESMDPKYLEVGKWPISRFLNGEWVFQEEFEGTLRAAYAKADELEKANQNGEYRVWDPR